MSLYVTVNWNMLRMCMSIADWNSITSFFGSSSSTLLIKYSLVGLHSKLLRDEWYDTISRLHDQIPLFVGCNYILVLRSTACRQMSFDEGQQTTNQFNKSSGVNSLIGMEQVSCDSQQDKLIDCEHQSNPQTNCTHANDVFLVCYFGACKLL